MSTDIEWTDETWNPVVGCTPVSPGCLNCYAAKMAIRLEGMSKSGYGPRRLDSGGRDVTGLPGLEDESDKIVRIAEVRGGRAVFSGDVRMMADRLTEPMGWKKPRMVFVNSMSDLFHEDVPFWFIDRVWAMMAMTPRHTYQILTKRPERMEKYFQSHFTRHKMAAAALEFGGVPGTGINQNNCAADICNSKFPLPNVWLGTSVESQDQIKRVWHVLKTPAAVRFVSAEPLLGPLDFNAIEAFCSTWRKGLTIGTYLDWVIVGGESGPKSRPCEVRWIRDIVRDCKKSLVPVFVKQMGAKPMDCAGCYSAGVWPWMQDPTDAYSLEQIHLNDRKGGTMGEWPEEFQVREFPEVVKS